MAYQITANNSFYGGWQLNVACAYKMHNNLSERTVERRVTIPETYATVACVSI